MEAGRRVAEVARAPRVARRVGPIHFASKHGSPQIVAALLEAGAKIEAKGFGDFSPLRYAVAGKHAAVVRVLLAAGADPKANEHLEKASPRSRKKKHG